MARYSLLAGLLILSFCSVAKEHTSHHHILPGQPQQQVAQKTTALQERLIGFSYRQLSSTTLLDTASYHYSGGRGSALINWTSDITPYESAPNTMDIKCDSAMNILGGYNHSIFKYNANNDAIEYIYEDTTGSNTGTLIPNDHRYYFYNGADHIANDSEYYYPYSSVYKTYHLYDLSGYLVEDSQYNVTYNIFSFRVFYVNDVNGNCIHWTYYTFTTTPTFEWVANTQIFYTYDAYNHVTSDLVQVNSGGASGTWVNSTKDSTFYTGSSDKYIYTSSYTWTAGAWQGTTADSFHVNGANQWDTMYYYQWNSGAFALAEKDYQAYDSYGNLQYSGGIQYNSVTHTYAAAPYDLNTYYYETYDPAGINALSATSASVSIYPNPVSHLLYLSLHDVAAGQKVNIAVTNILGQKMYDGQVQGSIATTVDMSAYAPGIYILSVSGGTLNHTEKIVKGE